MQRFSFNSAFRSGCFLLICSVLSLTACRREAKDSDQQVLTIRVSAEPDRLQPMLSKSPVASQIEQLIFYKLIDFDPETLELIPMLATALPKVSHIDTGAYAGYNTYDFEIRPEASWDNGSPVTGEDLLFSFKAALHPDVPAGSWKNFLEYIPRVDIDPANPKKIRIYLNKSYLLADVVAGNFEIYPAYMYDPRGILGKISYTDMLNADTVQALMQDSSFAAFAAEFIATGSDPNKISGCGPYRVKNWLPEQSLTLERKDKWWADALPANKRNRLLEAFPQTITYKVITDEVAAVTALKNQQVDVCAEIPAKDFDALQTSAATKEKFNFFTAKLMQFYFVGMQMQRPGLSDIHVRRALAHLMPVDQIIQQLFDGYAERINGPIHPDKPYFNKTLKPISYDVGAAGKLLAEGGWKDSDGNGILDKIVDGKKVELNFTLLTTTKKLGRDLALILQQESAKAGIRISIESVEPQVFQKRARARDFDLVNFALKQYPGYVDLESSWHTRSIGEKGNNICGFGDARSDAVIDSLNLAADPTRIAQLYKEFQALVFEAQPAIFLCSPLERIAVNNKWDAGASDRAPGYSEQLFKPR